MQDYFEDEGREQRERYFGRQHEQSTQEHIQCVCWLKEAGGVGLQLRKWIQADKGNVRDDRRRHMGGA